MRASQAIVASILLGTLGTSTVAMADDLPNEGAGHLATPGHFGLGIGGSSLASGITGKLYFTDALAGQLNVGWWLGAGVSLGADVIVERAFYKIEEISVQGYGGAGVSVGTFSIGTRATVFGVQGVGGVGLHVAEIPIEITAEIRPTVLIGNQFWNGFYFGGGGAIRYYF